MAGKRGSFGFFRGLGVQPVGPPVRLAGAARAGLRLAAREIGAQLFGEPRLAVALSPCGFILVGQIARPLARMLT